MQTPIELQKLGWTQSVADIAKMARETGWQKADILTLWDAHDLMAELFSGRYRGAGRPFVSHLAGTAALALRYDGGVTKVLAGYAHAAYEQGEQGRLNKGATPENRAELRSVLGKEAEEMVYLYRPSEWDAFCLNATEHDVEGLSPIARDVLFLQIVNELEDSCDADVYAATWREKCKARLVAGARFAIQLGYPELADHLHIQIEWMSQLTNDDPDLLRPKRSRTIKNRAMRRKRILSKRRKWARKLGKLFVRPGNTGKV